MSAFPRSIDKMGVVSHLLFVVFTTGEGFVETTRVAHANVLVAKVFVRMYEPRAYLTGCQTTLETARHIQISRWWNV